MKGEVMKGEKTAPNERRRFLGTLAAGALALPGAAALAQGENLSPGVESATGEEECLTLGPDARGRYHHGPGYFPNAVVTTHEGRRALFYEDLLRDRTVLIHFMSLAQEELRRNARRSSVENLVEVQRILGSRLGNDVFIYSLTVDPEHDTPDALRDLARRHGVGPGWSFVTGEPEAMETIRSRFFVDRVALNAGQSHGPDGHGPGGNTPDSQGAPAHPSGHDCSQGLLRYGNEALGLWGSCPQIADPHWIAARLFWVMPQTVLPGPHRRGGPFPRQA